jgi:hypothetical protein
MLQVTSSYKFAVVVPLVINGIPVTALLIYFGDVGNPLYKVPRTYVGNAQIATPVPYFHFYREVLAYATYE